MKRYIPVLLSLALLTGCGGGGGGNSSTSTGSTSSSSTSSTEVKTVADKVGKTTGQYNLWDYIAPSTDTTHNFIETNSGGTNSYSTTYTTTSTSVTEVSDYAANERTIYTKQSDRILVSFEKDGTPNGAYDMHLTADINDPVTIKDSTCRLTAHFDNKVISNKTFTDLIEINCDGKPGYYQKGTGEVAQIETLSVSGSTNIRILSH